MADVVSIDPRTGEAVEVVAQETTTEDRLRVQRTWLYGPASNRPALVLAFSHGAAPLDRSLVPGFAFEGDLCFYPGHAPRAAVKARGAVTPIARLEGLDTLDGLCDAASELRARQPWADELALPVRSLVPVRREGAWSLVDREQRALPARVSDVNGWRMLAISGGRPIDMVLGYEGSHVRPLALLGEGEFLSLANADAEAAA